MQLVASYAKCVIFVTLYKLSMAILNWLHKKIFWKPHRIAFLQTQFIEIDRKKQGSRNTLMLLLVAFLFTLFFQSWRFTFWSVSELAGMILATAAFLRQREKKIEIQTELAQLGSSPSYLGAVPIGGLLFGSVGGAIVGSTIGLAGAFGAVAGTIPLAIVGGITCLLAGTSISDRLRATASGTLALNDKSRKNLLPPGSK
jgi:Ca2+/Na+ antiporter